MNPTATAIAAVLVYGDASPLASAVGRVSVVEPIPNESFLNDALFVQIVPPSVKQASERIVFAEAIWQLVLLIVVVAASDYQIPEDIVSTSSPDVVARKSMHFSYCITALLLMHIRP